jgi:hypothetical protein
MTIPTGARSQGAGAAARHTKDRDIGDAQANQEIKELGDHAQWRNRARDLLLPAIGCEVLV